MKEIIDDVKQTIAQKQIRWAYPILLKLQKCDYHLAIKWAVECIQIYASEFNPDKLSQMNKYIQKAIEEQNVLTPLQCMEIAKELWYSPEREDIQTAVARLWWSIAAFKDGEEDEGAIEATMTVELVLPDISNRSLLDRYLEAALRIYEEYELQN
ncbi:MAG: hypothetical protein KME64_03150 [Scytonematopsis contorta HA4267-MV1]|jgi:hypothetical protein|nr:hypothetical protein [Scytonematopsis contorta HA4267-MV1]